jgi:hypothetical protein
MFCKGPWLFILQITISADKRIGLLKNFNKQLPRVDRLRVSNFTSVGMVSSRHNIFTLKISRVSYQYWHNSGKKARSMYVHCSLFIVLQILQQNVFGRFFKTAYDLPLPLPPQSPTPSRTLSKHVSRILHLFL